MANVKAGRKKLGEGVTEEVVVPPVKPPTARLVPGGRSYADTAAAWRDGWVLPKNAIRK